MTEEEFRAKISTLVAELGPSDAIGLFETAAAYDSTGHADQAVPLYRSALSIGLEGERRRRAVIQMASSLRNVGELEESIALLREERDRTSDGLDDAVNAFLALALADAGQEREALALVLKSLAGHLPRYQRSVRNYARLLVEEG